MQYRSDPLAKSDLQRMDAGQALLESADFPGQWFIENRRVGSGDPTPEVWTASCLRFLRTVSRTLCAVHPDREVAGRIRIMDPAAHGQAPSACLRERGRQLEARLEIPPSQLWEDRVRQEDMLRCLFSSTALSSGESGRRSPLPPSNSPGGGRLVQFVNCASLSEKRETQFSGVPPSVFFMAPALQKRGFRVAVDTLVLDAFAEPGLCPPQVRASNLERLGQILGKRPFCIAITGMDFYLEELRYLAREIRSRDPEVFIAFGGPLVTLYPDKGPVYLPDGNIFLRGEADVAFGELLSGLAGRRATESLSEEDLLRLEGQQGLFLRAGNTVYVSHLDRKHWMEDIDRVFQDEIDLSYVEKAHFRNGFSLHTTRGCPCRCSFCAKVHGSRVRALRAETIFRLLAALQARIEEIDRSQGFTAEERRKAYELSFSDDDFLLDGRRAGRVLQGIAGYPFTIRTIPAGIPSFLCDAAEGQRGFDPSLFDAIQQASGKIGSFEIGTDDFSERELQRLAKGHPRRYGLEEIREVLSRLEELRVSNRHFVILSNPDTGWSDLLEKLVNLEESSWSYAHFLPDPNPFVLAPVGTALFAQLVREGRAERLQKKEFSVPGFPEFTHWVFNLAPPREDIFSSRRLSCQDFFRSLSDLLKSSFRFSILNEAYVHLLETWEHAGPPEEEIEEKETIFRQIGRSVRMRTNRVSSLMRDPSFWKGGGARTTRKINLFSEMLLGTLLVREVLGGLFPQDCLRSERQDLEKTLDRLLAEVAFFLEENRDVPEALRAQVSEALRTGGEEIRCWSAGRGPAAKSAFPRSFVRAVQGKLEQGNRVGEAREWAALCAPGRNLLVLEVSSDRKDARFVEDSATIERFFELIHLAEPSPAPPVGLLPFLRAEWVLWKSLREDYLKNSETRIFLYDGLLALPSDFKVRFQSEFGVSPFFDRDEFIASLLAKFLACRAVPHDRRVLGTCLFEGLESTLEPLVHKRIEEFARWFFDRS